MIDEYYNITYNKLVVLSYEESGKGAMNTIGSILTSTRPYKWTLQVESTTTSAVVRACSLLKCIYYYK